MEALSAGESPKWPASHKPEHAAVPSPVVAPKDPWGHGFAVAEVDASGQKNPNGQSPEHAAVASLFSAPYVPAGQAAAVGLVEPSKQ